MKKENRFKEFEITLIPTKAEIIIAILRLLDSGRPMKQITKSNIQNELNDIFGMYGYFSGPTKYLEMLSNSLEDSEMDKMQKEARKILKILVG